MSVLSDAISSPNFSFDEVPDLTGRTAVVTGCSQGIGLELVRALALSHARVVCLSLDQERGEKAIQGVREDVKERAGHTPDLEWRKCDQRDLREVRKAADQIAKDEPRIDFLCLNAGIGVEPGELTHDGYDVHLTVDYLAEVVLVNRILPVIRKTAKQSPKTSCRIVTQSSELHRASMLNDVKFELDEFKQTMGPNEGYARAKLANAIFVRGLAKAAQFGEGKGAGIIRTLASHPGVVSTEQQEGFKRSYGMIGTLLAPVVSAIGRAPETGCLAMLWCTTSPDVDAEGYQAKYFDDPKHERQPSNQALDAELEANLFKNSEAVIRTVAGNDALQSWTATGPQS